MAIAGGTKDVYPNISGERLSKKDKPAPEGLPAYDKPKKRAASMIGYAANDVVDAANNKAPQFLKTAALNVLGRDGAI